MSRLCNIVRILAAIPTAVLGIAFACSCAEPQGELSLLDQMNMSVSASSEEEAETQPGNEVAVLLSSQEQEADCTVYICGAVNEPGVYTVPAGKRISDVLLLAGGFAADASTTSVNLAETVRDGIQVTIPVIGEAVQVPVIAAAEDYGQAGLVELNSATQEQLTTLPGIGDARARDIIAYRQEHGGFRAAEDLMEVPGIKQATYDKLKDLVYVR